jgi:hypothetical protein
MYALYYRKAIPSFGKEEEFILHPFKKALRHPIEESGSHEGEEAEAEKKRKRRSENSYPINERND